ncbi:regulatory protein, luxR family [Streptomyces sp. OK228]|nr:regulatory protein, luxR family [Streptomyces sp. OK228]
MLVSPGWGRRADRSPTLLRSATERAHPAAVLIRQRRWPVASEQALHLLPGRVPEWRAKVGVGPGLPQLRVSLCEALGLPSGALTHRAGPAGPALMWALAEPGVLFLDDAQRLTPSRRATALDRLTPREREVLALMAEGRTNQSIAGAFTVSERAVEKHIANIFAKLDLPPSGTGHRRVLAVLRYLGSVTVT